MVVKHRVVVLRAARMMLKNDPDSTMQPSESQGGTMTFYNRASPRSWALASVIGEFRTIYRSPKRIARNKRIPWFGNSTSYVLADRAEAIKWLDDRPDIVARYNEHAGRHTTYRDSDAATRAAIDADHAPERGVGALLLGGLDRRVRLRWQAD